MCSGVSEIIYTWLCYCRTQSGTVYRVVPESQLYHMKEIEDIIRVGYHLHVYKHESPRHFPYHAWMYLSQFTSKLGGIEEIKVEQAIRILYPKVIFSISLPSRSLFLPHFPLSFPSLPSVLCLTINWNFQHYTPLLTTDLYTYICRYMRWSESSMSTRWPTPTSLGSYIRERIRYTLDSILMGRNNFQRNVMRCINKYFLYGSD